MEAMVMGTTDQDDRTADPIEPRVPPVVRLGVGIEGDHLWRQRVDLLRQSRRIHRDLPAAIGLSARLPDGLSGLPSNRDLRGEIAAILKGRLCWNECCVRRAWGDLPDTARQDQQNCDTQKGMRILLSRNEAGTSRLITVPWLQGPACHPHTLRGESLSYLPLVRLRSWHKCDRRVLLPV